MGGMMTTLFVEKPELRTIRVQYVGIVVTAAIAFVSLALSAFAAYSHNDKDVSNRIVAVEVQQRNDRERATDDRSSTKRIEEKLDRFIEYETGVKP